MRIIKKLDLFIVKQFLTLLMGAFVICQFVLMMQFLWKYVDQLIGKGIPMDILAQFFWYMGLILVPQALPLSILLASLITFGNLGESVELTAIKAAGISLMQAFRPLIVVSCIIMGVSFYFQNVIGPNANLSFAQLLISMKQKSPELEIPEGVFYDGVPGSNIYVQKKDVERGMLYGLMIYRMTDSFDDAAIILADSGKIQSTADKKHLLLTLNSGEWFENMRQSGLGNQANVPYRRESFTEKVLLIDFNSDFDMVETAGIANDARSKSLRKIAHDVDSVEVLYDSIGRSYLRQEAAMMKMIQLNDSFVTNDILKERAKAMQAANKAQQKTPDSIFDCMTEQRKLSIIQMALNEARNNKMSAEFKTAVTEEGDHFTVMHHIETFNKFTLSLCCLIFFFIGAPLGAVIRKGGLGIPVLISVIVFIIYIVLDTLGYRMARNHFWAVWFGKLLATAILAPFAVYATYRANKDLALVNARLFYLLKSFFKTKRKASIKYSVGKTKSGIVKLKQFARFSKKSKTTFDDEKEDFNEEENVSLDNISSEIIEISDSFDEQSEQYHERFMPKQDAEPESSNKENDQ